MNDIILVTTLNSVTERLLAIQVILSLKMNNEERQCAYDQLENEINVLNGLISELEDKLEG